MGCQDFGYIENYEITPEVGANAPQKVELVVNEMKQMLTSLHTWTANASTLSPAIFPDKKTVALLVATRRAGSDMNLFTVGVADQAFKNTHVFINIHSCLIVLEDSSHGNTAWEIHLQWTWAFITLGHVWDPMLLQRASWSIHRNICCDPPSYFSA